MWFVLILVIFISVCTLSITNLYIFRLGFILSHSIGKWTCLYRTISSFCPHLLSPGNQKGSSAFSGYKMGIMVINGLIKFIIARWEPA